MNGQAKPKKVSVRRARATRVTIHRALVALLVLVSLLSAFLHVHVTGAHASGGPVSVAAATEGGAEEAACVLCAFVGGGVLAPARVVLELVVGCSLAFHCAPSRPAGHVSLDVCARGPPALLVP